MDGKLTNKILQLALPGCVIEKLAKKLEVVQRHRKVDIVLLVWVLVLGFPAGANRALASLRRRYEQMAGVDLARSAFHDRLNKKLADLMARLVDWCLNTQLDGLRSRLADEIEGFRSLLAVDSTVLSLHKMLAPTWEATNEGEAACKLHVISNVVRTSLNSVRITDQRTADNGPLKRIGSWVKDSLLMGDLAYYDFGLFHRIDQQGGYFLSRVKKGANPLIVASNQSHRGRSIDLVGKKLQDVLERLARETIDVTVELEVKLNKYRGTRSTRMRRFRMVGIRDDESGDYRLYFTNVDGEQRTPEQIAETYKLRWQVELLFTRLKTTMRLHQLPSSKQHIVRALIYASVLSLLVSGTLMRAIRQRHPDRVFPAQRFDAVFRDMAGEILRHIANKRGHTPPDVFELLAAQAADPNRSRARAHDILDELPLSNPGEKQLFSDACG